jgi:hypothetical protein
MSALQDAFLFLMDHGWFVICFIILVTGTTYIYTSLPKIPILYINNKPFSDCLNNTYYNQSPIIHHFNTSNLSIKWNAPAFSNDELIAEVCPIAPDGSFSFQKCFNYTVGYGSLAIHPQRNYIVANATHTFNQYEIVASDTTLYRANHTKYCPIINLRFKTNSTGYYITPKI